jgi:branched-chain amino acid aminotransferase
MARDAQPVIWMNGKFVAFEDAKIHILSHVVHYGSSVFEGIRAYDTPRGTAIFRLDRHVQRLLDSCKIARMDLTYGYDELMEACRETLRRLGDLVWEGGGAELEEFLEMAQRDEAFPI